MQHLQKWCSVRRISTAKNENPPKSLDFGVKPVILEIFEHTEFGINLDGG
jgi:hypothetical protein